MVLIVPVIGLSASDVFSVCLSYVLVRFSHGFNRPSSLVHRLSGSFSYGFPMVLIVPSSLVHRPWGSFSYCFPMVL